MKTTQHSPAYEMGFDWLMASLDARSPGMMLWGVMLARNSMRDTKLSRRHTWESDRESIRASMAKTGR